MINMALRKFSNKASISSGEKPTWLISTNAIMALNAKTPGTIGISAATVNTLG
ncbi:Uncharacterised protein [Vibrio cholerae]|nr:Uncharacterised protein [Vibrio cholerae]CSB89160.1 Uncharacterised protein [Vibrio cholerae]